jgi:hypothetical protein
MNDYVLYVMVSTAITRIGAVLLLIFGVQVLINFYRYNLRLAACYEARADAIELLGDATIESLPPLVASLSADLIAFDKPPKTPTHELADLAASLAELRKQKV